MRSQNHTRHYQNWYHMDRGLMLLQPIWVWYEMRKRARPAYEREKKV